MTTPVTTAVPSRFGLIIGAMKSGTTSLFNHLAHHPQVAPCRVKEPAFFCREDFDPENLAEYLGLWKWRPNVHRIAVEASVSYTKLPTYPDCAARIARCSDLDVRFIYCMRNPLDRIVSHVYHGLYTGWTQSLERGISDHVISCSKYAMQLDAYAACFDRDRIMLLVLEEFEKEPRESLRRICRFLGIDPSFEFPGINRRYNPALDHVSAHPVWRALRRLGPARTIARAAIPLRWRGALFRRTGRRMDVRRTLTPDEKSMLISELAADLRQLRSEYGIDPAAVWGIKPA